MKTPFCIFDYSVGIIGVTWFVYWYASQNFSLKLPEGEKPNKIQGWFCGTAYALFRIWDWGGF